VIDNKVRNEASFHYSPLQSSPVQSSPVQTERDNTADLQVDGLFYKLETKLIRNKNRNRKQKTATATKARGRGRTTKSTMRGGDETFPIRAELYTPANKVSAWVGKKEDDLPRDTSYDYQGVWVVEGYTIDKRQESTELWIFWDNDPEGIDRRVLENNPLTGTWGYAPGVVDHKSANQPRDLWFYPPASARCRIPEHLQEYNHRGTWVKPTYKRDFSSLGPNTSGFIDVSGNVKKGSKLSVAGKWKLMGFNDDVVRGRKKKDPDEDPSKGKWTIYVRRKASGVRFPLSVIPGTRISKCKDKIQAKKGLPVDEQRLSFEGIPLRDEKTLAGSGVRNGDTIDLDPMVVGVRTRRGKVYTFEVDPDELVEKLKPRVESSEGTPVEDQRLYFRNQKLQDGTCLSDYGIKHNGRIDLGPMVIYVKRLDDKDKDKESMLLCIELDVEPTDSLGSVKTKVKNRTRLPVADQRLSHRDKELMDDSATLWECRVKHLDTLFLIGDTEPEPATEPEPEPATIAAKPKAKSKAKTKVDRNDDPRDDPTKINRKPDRSDLRDGTTTTTTVTENIMNIYVVREWDRKKIKLQVEPIDTIRSVKTRIEASEDIPSREQNLTFQKQPVDDPKTLDESNIRHLDVLYLGRGTPKDPLLTNTKPKTQKRSPKVNADDKSKPTTSTTSPDTTPTPTPKTVVEKLPKDVDTDTDGDGDDGDASVINPDLDPETDNPRAPTAPRGIQIKAPDHRSFWLDPDRDAPTPTKDLKRKAAKALDLPVKDLYLVNDYGEILDDDDNMPRPGSVLNAAPLMDVILPDKSNVKVPLLPKKTFGDIKDLVEDKTGFSPKPNHRTFFLDPDGNEMEEDVPVEKSGIQPGLPLELCSVPVEEDKITVRSPDGRCFYLDVDPETDTVEDLKRKVAMASNLPVKDLYLVNDYGEILDDDDNMPRPGSVLNAAPLIEVAIPDKRKVKVPLLPTMKFEDIKNMINEKTRSPPDDNKRVFFLDPDGNEIGITMSVEKAGIQPGSTLGMFSVPVEEDKITVRSPDGRCFYLDVDPETATVKDLRRKVAKTLGLPVKHLGLVDDDGKIVDLDDDMPRAGSVLNAAPLIKILTPNKSKVKIPLLPGTTFDNIKGYVEEKTGSAPKANERVFFFDREGNEIDNKMPVEKAGIKPGEVLEMFSVPVEDDTITVRSPDGRCFYFDVDPESDKVEDLKRKAAMALGLPVKYLYLMDSDGEIADFEDDDNVIATRAGSVLDVAPLIDVTAPDGTKVKVPLLPQMKFEDIKDIIEKKIEPTTAKPNHRIFFLDSEGNEIEDDESMKKARITPESSLKMCSVPAEDDNITVRSPDGRCFHFDVDPQTDALNDLKARVANAFSLPIKDLYLVDEDGELVDVDADVGMPRTGSVLDVAPMIDVTMPDKSKVKVPLLPQMKFKDVKDFIEQKIEPTKAKPFHRIFFLDSEGNEMDDNAPVQKAGIKLGTAFEMCSAPVEDNKVTVRSPDGRYFHFDVDPETDTVKDLKARIANAFGIPMKELPSLLLDESRLDDDYSPSRGDVFDFDPMHIEVELPGGDKIIVSTIPMRTIGEIKKVIEEKTGINRSDQRIFFLDDDDQEIDDELTLSEAKVKTHTPLKVLSSTERKEPREIEIKDLSGRTFKVFLDPDESVREMKERIAEKIGFPIGGFKLDNKEWNGVDDDIPLDEEGFTVRREVILEVCPPAVEIELPNSKKMKMQILPSMTMKDVQELVKVEAPDLTINDIKHRMFFLHGIEELGDDTPFEKLKFEKGYEIEMQSIVINVQHWNGENFKLHVQSDWYIDDIKNHVHELTTIPPDQQNISFKGEPVKGDLQLAKQGIVQGSILILVPMSILVNIPHIKEPVRFVVKPSYTVEKIKRKAFKKLKKEKNDSSHNFCLLIGGRELDDKETLEEINIQHDDICTFEAFKLRVMHWSGKMFYLDNVRRNETIASLKERIFKSVAIPIDDQRLSLDGKRLSDVNTIEKEQVRHRAILVLETLDSKIEVPEAEKKTLTKTKTKKFQEKADCDEIMPVIPDWKERVFFFDCEDTFDAHIELIIMHWTGDTFTLSNILLQTKVSEIKNEILRARGIARKMQKIKFDGKILDEKKTLLEQSVRHRSVLVLEAPVKNVIKTPSVKRISGKRIFGTVPTKLITNINITVKDWNGDEFNLSPAPNDYIDDVKDLIRDVKSIPLEEIRLSFEGEPTQGDKNLQDQYIVDGSVLFLEPMRVFLELPRTDELVSINVEMEQMIRDVKKKIAKMSRGKLSLASICIMSGGEELDSSKTITDYGIYHEDTLKVETYQVKVMHFIGKVFTIDKVTPASTPRDVKDHLSAFMSFPIDELVLYLNGMILDDSRSLSDQGVRHKAVMILELPGVKKLSSVKEKASFSMCNKSSLERDATTNKITISSSLLINIQHWNGETFTIDAKPTEYVDDLKERIFLSKKIPINRQQLEFEDQPVCDQKCLKEQGIVNNTTLVLRQMIVYICDKDRKVALAADPKDSVLQLKKQFQKQIEIPIECQCLVLAGEELADAKKLSHYGIQDGQILQLEAFKVKILDWNGNVFEVTGIHSGSTVEELKARIQKLNSIPPADQVLTADGMPVIDTMRLKDQEIKHSSIVTLALASKSTGTFQSPVRTKSADFEALKEEGSESSDCTTSISTAVSQTSENWWNLPTEKSESRRVKDESVPLAMSSIANSSDSKPSKPPKESKKTRKKGKSLKPKNDRFEESVPMTERSTSKTSKTSNGSKKTKSKSPKRRKDNTDDPLPKIVSKDSKKTKSKSPKRRKDNTDDPLPKIVSKDSKKTKSKSPKRRKDNTDDPLPKIVSRDSKK